MSKAVKKLQEQMGALKAKLSEQEAMLGLCEVAVERAQTQIEKQTNTSGSYSETNGTFNIESMR